MGEPIHNPHELHSPGLEPQPAVAAAAQQQDAALRDQVSMSTGTRSPDEREQNSQAILQILSELQVLERYERRISSRRDRAIRQANKRR